MVLVVAIFIPVTQADNKGYLANAGHDVVRGLKNVVSFPAELVLTQRDSRYSGDRPFMRYLHGATDGTIRAIQRAFSGTFDLVAAWIPSQQEGMPMEPETLF